MSRKRKNIRIEQAEIKGLAAEKLARLKTRILSAGCVGVR